MRAPSLGAEPLPPVSGRRQTWGANLVNLGLAWAPRGQGRQRQTRDTRGELRWRRSPRSVSRGPGPSGTRPGVWNQTGGKEREVR